MDDAKSAAQSTVLFGQSQEATVGRNSRLLLKDGCIGWDGYEEQDVVRPTGPYDPDLYVLALRRADGKYGGLAFNHSVHNIGHIREDCMSPCFYGLAALEVERRHGATTLFLPGAFGSTHNTTYKNSGVPAAECVHRVVDAIEEALGRLQPALPGPVQVLNRQFTYHVRRFDEAKEALAVKSYLEKYAPQRAPGQVEMVPQNARRDDAAPGRGAPDAPADHPAGRHRVRRHSRRDVRPAGTGAAAPIALPAHVHHRAGQRADRLHSGPQGVCRWRLPDVGGLAQHAGGRHGRGDGRSGGGDAQ